MRWVGWTVGGLALGSALAHLALGEPVWWAAVLHAGAGWFGLPYALALGLCVAARLKGPAAVSGVALALWAGWCAPGLPRAGGGGRALRVVSANLYIDNDAPDALVAELSALDADLLVLAEVTPAWADRLAGLGYPHVVGEVQEGCFGLLILSRHPIDAEIARVGSTIPRVDAVVRVPGAAGPREVRVIGVHALPPLGAAAFDVWRAQLDALAAIPVDGPALIVGDLNATRHNPAVRALVARGWRDAHADVGRPFASTWPNGKLGGLFPWFRIDHALVSGLDVLAVAEGRGQGSDHRPVIVDVALR